MHGDDGAQRASWPRWRSWAMRPPVVVDVLLGVLVTALGLVSLALPSAGTRTPDALAVVLALLSGVPVLARSRAPLTTLALTLPSSLALFALGYPQTNGGIGAMLCVYSVSALRPRRLAAAATLVTLACVTATFLWLGTQDVPPAALAANLLAVLLFSGAGAWARSRVAYVRGLEERNAALVRARELREQVAMADARGTVAREIQDVLGHSLTALTVHAGAARQLVARDPAAAGEALVRVEELARSALADVRRVVGLLDEDPAPPTTRPLPRLADVPELVGRLREQGRAVSLERPGGGAVEDGVWDEVDDGPGLAVYRLVEESLRNAARHAGAATVRVRLAREDGWLVVSVADDGRGSPTWAAGEHGGGVGLVAVRERVESYGGSVTAGPSPGGGFEVVGRVPATAGRAW